MTDTTPRPTLNTGLLTSGLLLAGLGTLIGMIGLALGSAAVIGAGRRWQQGTGLSTSQLAKHAVDSARVAAAAGTGAWKGHTKPLGHKMASDGDQVTMTAQGR